MFILSHDYFNLEFPSKPATNDAVWRKLQFCEIDKIQSSCKEWLNTVIILGEHTKLKLQKGRTKLCKCLTKSPWNVWYSTYVTSTQQPQIPRYLLHTEKLHKIESSATRLRSAGTTIKPLSTHIVYQSPTLSSNSGPSFKMSFSTLNTHAIIDAQK